MIRDKIKNLTSSEGSLQQRAIRSGFWSFLIRGSTRGLSLLKVIIVARILAPKDFGLLGIALLTLAIFKVFTKTGFKESIIQNKKNIKHYLNTAWTVLVGRGLALYGVVFLSAPYIATFFGEPRAEMIIRVIGLVLVFRGLRNIGTVTFRKELQFHKKFILDLSKSLPGFLVTLYFAYTLGNVWALVYGTIAGAFVSMIVSYFLHPHRPKPEFKKEKAREMFGFGKWILGSSVLGFLYGQGDDIFVGKLLGATSLGFYQMAYRISNTPASEITHVISNVTFPAYSKVQDNIKKLREGYLKTLRVITFFSFPLAFGIIALAPEFVRIILGEKWITAILPMQILALWGLLRSLGATTGPVFQAIGKPKISTKLQFLKVVSLFIIIIPFLKWKGIIGVSLAIVLDELLIVGPMVWYKVIKVTHTRIKEFLKILLFSLWNSTLMLLVLYILKIFFSINSVMKLAVLTLFGIVSYFFIVYIFEKIINERSLKLIKNILSLNIKGCECK